MNNTSIPFPSPYITGKELYNIAKIYSTGRLSGDGFFTQKCHTWLERNLHCCKSLLTHSCTAALELSALLLDIRPNDEIIMPSYTFASTANAFVLRGGIPVFIDIRADTLNMDECLLEAAITPRTKAIVPVHYAGVSCAMDSILHIAHKYNLAVVEDAAQSMMAAYKGQSLGTLGDMGTLSFHETKNITSGEGGALCINNPCMHARAEIIREKGTDRSRFFRGETDRYTWQEAGSSFLPSEIVAAFLFAQLEDAATITHKRLEAWHIYHSLLAPLEQAGLLRRPSIPEDCQHNGHIYYIILPSHTIRQNIMRILRQDRIESAFHYTPLHSSPAGRRYGRVHGSLKNTETLSERLLRLPLWTGMTYMQQEYTVCCLKKALQYTTTQRKQALSCCS